MLGLPLTRLSPSRTQYPAYLAQHRSTLPADDLARYEKQHGIVREIVAKFEEPGADQAAGAEGPAKLSAEEESKRQKRMDEVVDLVAKVRPRFPFSRTISVRCPDAPAELDERMRRTAVGNHGRDAARCAFDPLPPCRPMLCCLVRD